MAKFEIEPGISMLMIMRLVCLKTRGDLIELKAYEDAGDAYEQWVHIGTVLRRKLREAGFDRDCEIDNEMEELARLAFEAYENLGHYIAVNSPQLAKWLAKMGDRSLLDWQNAIRTPIRPLMRPVRGWV